MLQEDKGIVLKDHCSGQFEVKKQILIKSPNHQSSKVILYENLKLE